MSFFKALFGGQSSNVDAQPDSVWLSRPAKYQGIRSDLEKRSPAGCIAVLLVSHFEETHDEMKTIAEEFAGDVPVMAVLAHELSAEIASGLEVDENKVIELIIAERHPLPKHDDNVIEGFAKLLACRCRATCHVALDDKLMKVFAGESMVQLLQQMGMKDDERIESGMVTRRIRAAQKKIAALATGNQTTKSEEEWFEKNMGK